MSGADKCLIESLKEKEKSFLIEINEFTFREVKCNRVNQRKRNKWCRRAVIQKPEAGRVQ